MTSKQLEKLQNKSYKLYKTIEADASGSLLDLINEYVEIQLLLEAESNK